MTTFTFNFWPISPTVSTGCIFTSFTFRITQCSEYRCIGIMLNSLSIMLVSVLFLIAFSFGSELSLILLSNWISIIFTQNKSKLTVRKILVTFFLVTFSSFSVWTPICVKWVNGGFVPAIGRLCLILDTYVGISKNLTSFVKNGFSNLVESLFIRPAVFINTIDLQKTFKNKNIMAALKVSFHGFTDSNYI